MRTQMTRRTKAALLAGVVLCVGGAGGAAYLRTRDSGTTVSVGKVSAYYAASAVEAGTAASTALAQGLIRPRPVLPSERPANGVSDPTQLTGRVAGATIPAGS